MSLDLCGDVRLDMLPREITGLPRHATVDQEHAKPSDRVGVALNRFGRLVGGSERQLKTANEQRNVRGTRDRPKVV